MYYVIIQVLKEQGNYDDSKTNEKFKIDIHNIFTAMTTSQFYRNCPCVIKFQFFSFLTNFSQFLNKRDTQGNIKIVKVSLILYTRNPPLLRLFFGANF